MGQFSWYAQDTGNQIFNDFDKQIIHMVDPRDGTDYIEKDYDGYGRFGGRDFYELLADINKDTIKKYCKQYADSYFGSDYDTVMNKNYKELTSKELDQKRGLGIDIWFKFIEPDTIFGRNVPEGVEIISPILVEDYSKWKIHKGIAPTSDPDQGWHLCDEPEDEEY